MDPDASPPLQRLALPPPTPSLWWLLALLGVGGGVTGVGGALTARTGSAPTEVLLRVGPLEVQVAQLRKELEATQQLNREQEKEIHELQLGMQSVCVATDTCRR